MPIQWRPFRPRVCGPQFLRVPPQRVVWFCSAPHQHTILDLHWLPSGKGSFPCLGDECMHCPGGVETHAYTVVLFTLNLSHVNWTPAIVDLGKPDKELAQLDLRGRAVLIGRKGGSDKQTPLEMVKEMACPESVKPKVCVHRDAKPYLLARWNFQEVEEYFAPRPDETQQRLDFGGDK